MRIFGKNDTKLLMGDGTGGGTGCAGRRPRNISVTINICREPACPITVFSLIFFYMRGTHERLCLKLNQKVLKGEYGV